MPTTYDHMDTTTYQVVVWDPLRARLREYVKTKGQTISGAMRQALIEFLDRHQPIQK